MCIAVRCVAFGPRYVLSKNWDRVELLLVLLAVPALAGTAIYWIRVPTSSFFYLAAKSVSRTFLLLRIIRIGTLMPSVKFMLNTLLLCIPSMFSTLVVLIIFVFAFTVLGMSVFGLIDFSN